MKSGVQGLAEIKANIAKIDNAMDAAVFNALLGGGKLIESTAKKLIAEVSQGKTVMRHRGKGTKPKRHVASKPGDAPNTDTGKLIRSIHTEPVPEQLAVYVGTAVNYAPHLEFGTKDGTLQPRPFLGPAYQQRRQEVVGLLAKAVKGALRGVAD